MRYIRRPLAFWLAVIAMAFNVLWPLIAQAAVRASVRVPVCTVEGVTHYIELPTGKTPCLRRASTSIARSAPWPPSLPWAQAVPRSTPPSSV